MSTFDKVADIISDTSEIPREEITPDSHTIDDLGIDSLGLVESIFAIEEEFDITVPFNANDPSASEFDISSVTSVIAGVERLIADQKT